MRDSILDCYPTGSIIVADTSAFLTGFAAVLSGTIYTTSDVLYEIKDENSRNLVERLLNAGKLSIIEPERRFIEIVRNISSKVRTLKKLSETDIKVLALALHLDEKFNCPIYIATDDYSIQYTAERLKIKILKMRYKGIKT